MRNAKNRQAYPTDLNDAEWKIIAPYFPQPKAAGRPRAYLVREILNAIFYIVRSGCAWRMMPHDLPDWKTVYPYFRRWRLDGTWEPINHALNEAVREQEERNKRPSAVILDRV